MARASVLQTERSHARNQQRAKPQFQKSRGIRRQVASYVVQASKERSCRIRKAHNAHMKSLSTLSWSSFRAALSKKRSLRGGNHTFTDSNQRSKAVKGTMRKPQFVASLRSWRERFPLVATRMKKQTVSKFLVNRRKRREQQAAMVNKRQRSCKIAEGEGYAESLAATHFGMGSAVFPISPSVLQKCLDDLGHEHRSGRRGGLRKLAANLPPERSLVHDAYGRSLQPQRRDACSDKHSGPDCETEHNTTLSKQLSKMLPLGWR